MAGTWNGDFVRRDGVVAALAARSANRPAPGLQYLPVNRMLARLNS
jgi:hypothetical protein